MLEEIKEKYLNDFEGDVEKALEQVIKELFATTKLLSNLTTELNDMKISMIVGGLDNVPYNNANVRPDDEQD